MIDIYALENDAWTVELWVVSTKKVNDSEMLSASQSCKNTEFTTKNHLRLFFIEVYLQGM